MKIKSIKIAGFRGFNTGQEIIVDKKLTIIYGPNSYGKTSISEALEWLLFGITSKVDVSASGKKEFKGTYRNIHFPTNSTPYVEVILNKDDVEITIRGELGENDSINKFLNGSPVDSWPWEIPELKIYSPFILQHALQDLLLTTPSDRYSRFSKLLGTQMFDDFQDIFNSLATRYNPPAEVQTFLNGVEEFLLKLNINYFDNILKSIRGKHLSKVIEHLNRLVSEILEEDNYEVLDQNGKIKSEILEELIACRKEEVSAIFDKDIVIQGISEHEQADINAIQHEIASFTSQELIDQYLEYAKLQAHAEYKKQSKFFDIGFQIIEKSPDKCPFCGTELTDDITDHIAKKHESINKQIDSFKDLDNKKTKFLQDLETFKQLIEDYFALLSGKVASLAEIDNEEDIQKIEEAFGEENQVDCKDLLTIMDTLSSAEKIFAQNKVLVLQAIEEIEESFVKYHQSTEHVKQLGVVLLTFISSGKDLNQKILTNLSTVLEISGKFEKHLNELAGTQKLALIISLLEQFIDIKKYILIQSAVDSMKDLRANVTDYVSKKTKTIVEDQLTDEVMHWYKQIKTDGGADDECSRE